MLLSNFSVKRPIAMTCVIICLALLGLRSYEQLGLELMPKMDIPFITVVTPYPGASPEDIELDVGKRIEDAVMTLEGLKHVETTAMDNVCITTLEFELGTDVDIMATEVREQLNMIRADLPANTEDPQVQKFDLNAAPVLSIFLGGEAPLADLYEYADNDLRDRLSTIRGVADVQLTGGAERELHVRLDRDKLAARGLTSLQVTRTLSSAIGTVPAGRVREKVQEFTVKYDADLTSVISINDLELKNENGQRVRLRDVGGAIFATEELRQSATLDGKQGISIKVVKKGDANAVKVVDLVREQLKEMERTLPGGMEIHTFTDDSVFIRASSESAWVNVAEGILLTALILFFFLYNIRSLVVVAVSMPLTIVVGLFFMNLIGYSLNTSTLIAMGMSVGILVTNSIVVLEAIVSHLDKTGDPRKAAMQGAAEVFIPVLASAATNIVVLLPLSVMGSLFGLFIKPIATTMLIMTAVSLFVSFTLTPLLSAVLLKPRKKNDRSMLARMERLWNRMFDALTEGYRKTLQFFERNRLVAVGFVLLCLGLLIHSGMLAGKVGSSLVQNPDKGELLVKMEFPTYYSLAKTEEQLAKAEARLKKLPHIKHILATAGKVESLGGGASEGVYLAQVQLLFSQRTERQESIFDLLERANDVMGGFPDAIITTSVPSLVGGQSLPVEMELSGDDFETLDRLIRQIKEEVAKTPGILTPDTTARDGKPQLRVTPRREVLADQKIAPINMGYELRGNLEGLDAGTFKYNARNYDIVVRYADREGSEQVADFKFPGAAGKSISLSTLADVEERKSRIQIRRRAKRRLAVFTANLSPDYPLDQAVAGIRQVIQDKVSLPPGYTVQFFGDYEHMQSSQAALGEALLISVILVLLTMAAIMESFRQPLLILVTVPLAFIGMIWALFLTGESISLFVIMGFVMMVGIVVNNAILIIDQFNMHVHEGIPRHKAMITAACERMRPIIMITLAAVLGMMPLAMGQGIGAEMRNGVGIASVGGIFVSGILTLFLLPILYDLFTSANGRLQGKRKSKPSIS